MPRLSLLKTLMFSTVMSAVLSTGCGTSRPANVSGNWFWGETPVAGKSPSVNYDVLLSQKTGTLAVTGIKTSTDGTTCAITGTVTGQQLQATAANPCGQTFSLTISSDSYGMQGNAMVSGQINATVTAHRQFGP